MSALTGYPGNWSVKPWLKVEGEKKSDPVIEFVIKDNTLPTVEIQWPNDGFQTNDPAIIVLGTAKDNADVSEHGVVQVDWTSSSGSGTAMGQHNWTGVIPLEEGENVITVVAKDEAGNESEPSSVTVIRDEQATDDCFQVYGPALLR